MIKLRSITICKLEFYQRIPFTRLILFTPSIIYYFVLDFANKMEWCDGKNIKKAISIIYQHRLP